MNDIYLNNSSCDFEGDLVGYLYDEANVTEKRIVEQHLSTCDHCLNELSTLSSSRSAVGDWCSSEFKGLPTPEFAFSEETKSSGSSSRSIWAFLGGWRLAASGMAAAVLFVMVTVYFLRSGAPASEVAVEMVPAVTTSSVLDDLRRRETAPSKNTNGSGIAPTTAPFADTRTASRPVSLSTSIGSRRNSNSPTPRRPHSTDLGRQRNTPPDSSVAKRKTSTPNLNGFEEKEDETLRLEDLFAEIDAG